MYFYFCRLHNAEDDDKLKHVQQPMKRKNIYKAKFKKTVNFTLISEHIFAYFKCFITNHSLFEDFNDKSLIPKIRHYVSENKESSEFKA